MIKHIRNRCELWPLPAHDERDYEFAKVFGLDIIPVIEGGNVEEEAYTGDGVHIHSDFLDGLNKADAIAKMNEWLEEHGVGAAKVSYRLRDWLFSRQRYWGRTNSSYPLGRRYYDNCS